MKNVSIQKQIKRSQSKELGEMMGNRRKKRENETS